MVDAVMEVGIRLDFQDRGYFKVFAHDLVVRFLDLSDAKQRVLIAASLTEVPQFPLGTLIFQNAATGHALTIPAATLRDQFHIPAGLADQELFRPSHFCARRNDKLRVLSNESASSSSQCLLMAGAANISATAARV